MFVPCFVVHSVVSKYVIISLGKRGLLALILWLASALSLFLKVPLVGLQCVIVAFPGHAHLRLDTGIPTASHPWSNICIQDK